MLYVLGSIVRSRLWFEQALDSNYEKYESRIGRLLEEGRIE
jgi:hypothetical protein